VKFKIVNEVKIISEMLRLKKIEKIEGIEED
jgi:hypothetical protein